uniref:Cytochrome c oxidase subunit 3 n=1 Tax=Setaphyes kielensis TaxID=3298910 RepID=A0A1I9VTT7_9BILA|nr:cytochrome c oxidase subunit III [Pycnophyes kielensis]APA17410.1 cytochrome c oxidase subunit 3 [Pycnophyes kielensis]
MVQNNPFNLITRSPWPIFSGSMGFVMALGLVYWMHMGGAMIMTYGGLMLTVIIFLWWRDLTVESSYQGYHSSMVVGNLRFGFLLFIVSEVMFFFSFFWGFFHSSLSPTVDVGCQWPPAGVVVLNYLGTPLLNSVILLSSGVFVTASHIYLRLGMVEKASLMLAITVFLGILFTGFQVKEYFEVSYSIADSVYGSAFFTMTGFHGVHVFVGTSFLISQFIRMMMGQFCSFHHLGFDASIWYWHFVDVVWLFLYTVIYVWGS